MQAVTEPFTAGTTAPPEVTADLPPDEVVFRVAPVRLGLAPDGRDALAGVAVLTSERIAIVPGAPGSPTPPRPSPGSFAEVIAGVIELVKPVLAEFPIARVFASQRRVGHTIASRSRPSIEIPLHSVRRAFEARARGWLGLELALPSPDPRPPFALYLEVGDAREWASLIGGARGDARPMPDIERPYALYYLLRSPPRPFVRVRGQGVAERGLMRLADDGPTFGGTREWMLLPYEAITRLTWSEPTAWRRGGVTVEAGEREWKLEPARKRDQPLLYDASRILGEISGAELREAPGSIRSARIVTWLAMTGSAAAAIAYEILRS